jgi:hypothetical protein
MKKILFIIAITLTCSLQTLADIIITANGSHYGKITAISNNSVSLLEGCNGDVFTTDWDTRTIVIFNDECVPPAVEASTSPVEANFTCDKDTVFSFSFKNSPGIFYCTAISFDGDELEFELYDGRKFKSSDFGTRRNIAAINMESVCKTFIHPPSSIPDWLEAE